MALPGVNEIEVANRLRETMEKLRPTLPKHNDMQLAFDATKFMSDSLKEISKTLSETILIVGLVVFVFMVSIRTAIVPAGGYAGLFDRCGPGQFIYMGFSLNLLTLLAIVLAVGLVVDDAIVVVENVQRHISEGHSRIHAAAHRCPGVGRADHRDDDHVGHVFAPIGFKGGLNRNAFS